MLYLIEREYARANSIPMVIEADKLEERAGTIRLRGTGVLTSEFGVCVHCGIECGKLGMHDNCATTYLKCFHPRIWKTRFMLKNKIKNIKFDMWFPLTYILKTIGEEKPMPKQIRRPKNMKRVAKLRNKSEIDLHFSEEDEYIQEQVKTVAKYRYLKRTKVGVIPLTQSNIHLLEMWKFKIATSVRNFLPDEQRLKTLPSRIKKRVKFKLFPYQVQGVTKMERRKGRVLLSDEMGLGKTAQALSWLACNTHYMPAVVVCPSIVKSNWKKEIQALFKKQPNVQVISGRATSPISEDTQIIIINPDILTAWQKTIIQWQPKTIMVDEAHQYKETKTARTKSMKTIAAECKARILITGTPVVNDVKNVYNIVEIVEPAALGSWPSFKARFMRGRSSKRNARVEENLKSLNSLLESFTIRRLKKDVMKEMPSKIRTTITIPIKDKKHIDKAYAELKKWLKEKGENNKAHALKLLGLLRLAIAKSKLPQVLEFCDNLLESTDKLVIVAHHKCIVKELVEHFPKKSVLKLDGDLNDKQKEQVIEAFNNDPSKTTLVINDKTGGTGTNLQVANHLVRVEFPWTALLMAQVEDRIHRTGQTKTCNIWNMVAEEPVEEKMIKLLNKKQKLSNIIVDAGNNESRIVKAKGLSIQKDILSFIAKSV